MPRRNGKKWLLLLLRYMAGYKCPCSLPPAGIVRYARSGVEVQIKHGNNGHSRTIRGQQTVGAQTQEMRLDRRRRGRKETISKLGASLPSLHLKQVSRPSPSGQFIYLSRVTCVFISAFPPLMVDFKHGVAVWLFVATTTVVDRVAFIAVSRRDCSPRRRTLWSTACLARSSAALWRILRRRRRWQNLGMRSHIWLLEW